MPPSPLDFCFTFAARSVKQITIYTTPTSEHIAQVLTGLVQLEDRSALQIRTAPMPDELVAVSRRHLLWMDVEHDQRVRRLCFDMLDGDDLDDGLLAQVDCCFKRSYSERAHQATAVHRSKVRPYGLNYGCTSMSLRFHSLANSVMCDEPHAQGLASWISQRTGLGGSAAASALPFSSFERAPHHPVRESVICITRLWSTDDVPGASEDSLRALNDMRISLVAMLSRALGRRFTGGLEDNPTARRLAGELIFRESTKKRSYLAMMQEHLVGVASTGLHGSIGWKLPEYVASSRCIVSEPLRFAVPGAFREGVNYLSYDSAERCVQACDELLSDPDRATRMRVANADYYTNWLRPDVLVKRCLEQALCT